jgi:hypothetical protein
MHKRALPYFLMAVEDGGDGGGSGAGAGEKPTAFTPITSQDELNKALAERLQRERAKFADYNDLKAKANRLDELEAASKSEAEKVAERIAALESENKRIQSEALRSRIQAKHGISDDDAALFLTGADEETLTAQAKRLAEREADRKKRGNVAPKEGGAADNGSRPDSDLREFTRSLFGRTDD